MVKTIEDLIYWEYAKMMAESAKMPQNYRFIVSRLKELKNGKIHMSGTIRENKHERTVRNMCIYCGSTENIQTDHIVPVKLGGPDDANNLIDCCRTCNIKKSNKHVFEFCTDQQIPVPRIVKGKYLKLVYAQNEKKGTLQESDIDGNGKLDVYDLCAIFGKEKMEGN